MQVVHQICHQSTVMYPLRASFRDRAEPSSGGSSGPGWLLLPPSVRHAAHWFLFLPRTAHKLLCRTSPVLGVDGRASTNTMRARFYGRISGGRVIDPLDAAARWQDLHKPLRTGSITPLLLAEKKPGAVVVALLILERHDAASLGLCRL